MGTVLGGCWSRGWSDLAELTGLLLLLLLDEPRGGIVGLRVVLLV